MAVKTYRPFPAGYRLIEGTHLNNLFQGNEQIQAANVSGALTVGGIATFNGAQVYAGPQSFSIVTVKATGATAGTARAIAATAAIVYVTATASTEGVKLPVAVTGKFVQVFASPTIGVKVYGAAAGQKVATGTTNTTAFAVTKNTAAGFLAINNNQWVVDGA